MLYSDGDRIRIRQRRCPERHDGMVLEKIWKDVDSPERMHYGPEEIEKASQGGNQLIQVHLENCRQNGVCV